MTVIHHDNVMLRSTTFSWTAGLPWQRAAKRRAAGIRGVLTTIPAHTFDTSGHTALHAAAHAGDALLVRQLITKHPELINAQATVQTSTPLHAAVAGTVPSIAVVRNLLKHGADPRVRASLDVGVGAFDADHLTPREIIEALMNRFPSEQDRLTVIHAALLEAEVDHDRSNLQDICTRGARAQIQKRRRM